MKSIFKWGFLMVILINHQTVDAQIFKKLKDKVEKKLEQKTEEKIDKKIEEVFTKKEKRTEGNEGKDKPNKRVANNIDYGDVIITHSNTYNSVEISEVSKIKATQLNSGWSFKGSWWSHQADIHDGFYLTVKTTDNLRHDINNEGNLKRTFKIPEEATLKLSYDPLLPHYDKSEDNYKRAVTDDYQTYDVSKGEVTIDVLSGEAIQISFSGKVALRKVVRHSNNSEDYSETFFEATVKGGIDGVSPEFINNKTVKKKERSTQNGADYTLNETPISTAKPGIYQFTFETKVKVTVPEQNRSFEMSYLLNPNEKYMGIMVDMGAYSDEDVAGESIIVIDKGDSHIFVETQGMKMQMSQNMMRGQQMQNPTDLMENYDYTNLKKTGKTKTILGATCHEYSMSDNSMKMNLWVAPDVNLPNWFIQNQELIKGYIMEYTVESKDGNMTSETIAINDNINKTINPKDYKKMF